MRFRPATIMLVFGLIVGTFAYATPQGSQSQQTEIPQLPSPTGQFGVGRVGYEWMDGSRPDGHAADSKAHRDLMVYLWYPALKAKVQIGVGWPVLWS